MFQKLAILLSCLLASAGAWASEVFVCNTERHAVVVDTLPSGEYCYRSWNKPRGVAEEPDLTVLHGEEAIEGTGPCRHTVWYFTNGNVRYSVSTLGCTEDDPPENASGELSVSVNGEHRKSWWCIAE